MMGLGMGMSTGGGGQLPIGFVTSNVGTSATATVVITITPTKVGQLILVIALSKATQATITVSDDQGNAYTQVTAPSGTWGSSVYSATSVNTNLTTITVTYASTGSQSACALIYSNVVAIDSGAGAPKVNQAGSGTTADAGSLTTSQPNEWIVTAAICSSGTINAGPAGYTNRRNAGGSTVMFDDSNGTVAQGANDPQWGLSISTRWLAVTLALVP